ncbi:hypothetical protein XMIN_1777 [Xanthomonas citri pv. mangiferaeindicae LMG 941]|nr:hypothetical protein XMIN_1777 [Xanthomonas citri pv. mangiferaeindicae LMG 941]
MQAVYACMRNAGIRSSCLTTTDGQPSTPASSRQVSLEARMHHRAWHGRCEPTAMPAWHLRRGGLAA